MSSPETPNGSVTPGPGGAYRVLARKYRPTNFADLIGQDAMVRTISNAFEAARIPQAWILTGVRGVGKTTTARILARALNYELPDGSIRQPTIHMPSLGLHCAAIMESRHPDVIEMDAASHNGVEDVRQINDAIRYAPMSARYKVYILDEVHMLSTQAFNALLKTLEEPPPHAKFVFATTETRKVPVTVLSRCQRFDLRRVDADVLVRHLGGIAAKEQITVEPEALALIARAAEGSVRDSLSLLDQAIAHAAAPVRGEHVRQMLGLADRARTIDLFEAVMRGDLAPALAELRDQYDTGADPAVVLSDLAEFTHFVTRVKIVPAVANDLSLAEAERRRGRGFAEKLSIRVLARTWQMLLKGIAEVEASGRPLAAAEMVLVRLAHAADLPSPDEVIRALDEKASAPRSERSGAERPGGMPAGAAPSPTPPRLEASRGGTGGGATALQRPVGMAMASNPVAQVSAAAAEPAPLAVARFADLIELAAQKRDQASRRRSSGTCGWCATRTAVWKSRCSRAPRARWSTICRASSRNGPAGVGWWWCRRSRARRPCMPRARRGPRSSRPGCAPTRWCRRCWRAFRVPRSSTCGKPARRQPRWASPIAPCRKRRRPLTPPPMGPTGRAATTTIVQTPDGRDAATRR
jgi:DNA polymerase-3 subunit gamma/tau